MFQPTFESRQPLPGRTPATATRRGGRTRRGPLVSSGLSRTCSKKASEPRTQARRRRGRRRLADGSARPGRLRGRCSGCQWERLYARSRRTRSLRYQDQGFHAQAVHRADVKAAERFLEAGRRSENRVLKNSSRCCLALRPASKVCRDVMRSLAMVAMWIPADDRWPTSWPERPRQRRGCTGQDVQGPSGAKMKVAGALSRTLRTVRLRRRIRGRSHRDR